MVPASALPAPGRRSTLFIHIATEGGLLRLAWRICPFLLALVIAGLVAGCSTASSSAKPPSTAAASRAPQGAAAGSPEAAAKGPSYRVVLPAEGASSLKVGMPLGTRDLRAERISVVVEWFTSATGCAFRLQPRIASRSGKGRPTTEGERAGVVQPGDGSDLLPAGDKPGEVQVKPYLMSLRQEATYSSGEMVTVEFTRNPEAPDDTCESDLVITAVRFSAGAELASEALRTFTGYRPGSGVDPATVRTAVIRP